MKNKFSIGLITVFVAISTSILILNFSNSSSNKNNYFDRKFSKNEILKLDKEFNKLNKNSLYETYYSNTTIVEGRSKDKKNYNLYFSDYSFATKKNKNIKLPIDSNVLFVDDNCVIYSCKLKLYKLELGTNATISISMGVKKVDVSFLISLKNRTNKYLFFGEILENNIYKTGFFILDISNSKIIESKILQSNQKKYCPEIIAMHSGYFQKPDSNSLVYTCDKNSKIFLFDENGFFIKELNTKDKTPLPKVIKESNMCYYSRDGLRFSNSGLFMDKKNIFVFSMASKYKNIIVIDQYSKSTMQYVQSFKLNYNKHCSNEIDNIFIDNNRIILKFEFNYASFLFSRYI